MNRTDSTENFAMIRLQELADVLSLTRDRQLEQRDHAVLNALIASINWRTGRCETSGSGLATKLGRRQDNIRGSLSRLRKWGLVVWVADRGTGQAYYLLNPGLVFCGTQQQRGLAWQQWKEALDREEAG
jgi:hypothetical protein